ncbi:hypothetical protein TWF679_002589, partial [Orbilia oligospora]
MHILSTLILTITSLATLVVAIPIPIITASDGISNTPSAGGVQQGSMSRRSTTTTTTSGISSREMNIKVNIKRSDQDSR